MPTGKIVRAPGGVEAAPGISAKVRELGLDRRKRYVEWYGLLCTNEWSTIECSGCTDYGDYGTRYGPYGCRECGYTGKARTCFPDPVHHNGELVPIDTGG